MASEEIVAYWEALDKYEHFKDVDCVELRIIWGERVLNHLENIKKQWRKMLAIKHDKSTITQDMIQTAKDYPFEELYPFKRGYALCPFHPDSKPSMSLKNNKVRCWSCMDKNMDTIEFLMKLQGLTFQEAVRRLQ